MARENVRQMGVVTLVQHTAGKNRTFCRAERHGVRGPPTPPEKCVFISGLHPPYTYTTAGTLRCSFTYGG